MREVENLIKTHLQSSSMEAIMRPGAGLSTGCPSFQPMALIAMLLACWVRSSFSLSIIVCCFDCISNGKKRLVLIWFFSNFPCSRILDDPMFAVALLFFFVFFLMICLAVQKMQEKNFNFNIDIFLIGGHKGKENSSLREHC